MKKYNVIFRSVGISTLSIILIINCVSAEINSYHKVRSLQTNSTGSDQVQPNKTNNTSSANKSDGIPPSNILPPNDGSNSSNLTYVDVIKVDLYNTKLSSEERKEYYYWVDYKNSFNTNEGQLAKMTKYFAPESPTYYSTIFKSGWPFHGLGIAFLGLFLVYLFKRFLCRGFVGPKKDNLTEWYGYFTYTLIGKIYLN